MSAAPGGLISPASANEQLRFPGEVQVELIQSPAQLHNLEPRWRELWSSVPDSTPFQSPDWLLPWCAHYCPDPLFCFAFHASKSLVGFAPLFIDHDRRAFRRLLLLGTGNTDYLDVIFQPEVRKECWRLLAAEIEKCSDLWDECNLQRLRPESPLLQGIAPNQRFLSEVSPQQPCPVLELREVDSAASMLKKAQCYAAKLGQRHPFSIERVTPASLNECFAALRQLHQERWREKGMPGVLSHDNDHAFHLDVARRLLAAHMLRLYCLRIAGEIAAVLYGFQHRSRTFFYLSGFDPAYSRFSIGTVLLGHSIAQALSDGCEYFDFLKGREPYKYRWGARDQPVLARTISKNR